MPSLNCLFQVVAALWGLSATVLATRHNDVIRTELLSRNETLLLHQQQQQRAACPEDYSPCTCDLTADGLEVTCTDVSVQDIQDVFFRTQTFRLYLVMLSPSAAPSAGSSSISLPADLLQDKRAENIFIICPPNASPSIGLTIDPAAFEFTRFNTSVFGVFNCDLAAQIDMTFLNDFSALNTLRFENTLNVGIIESLPVLPALKKLIISGCTGLETAAFPDLTPARLQRLYLNGNALTDEAVNAILVSVGSSSSASSLQELILANDAITRIPRLASFSKLSVLDVSYNVVPFISQFTFDFGGPSSAVLVSLKSISLTAIEGGAFQGDYSYAQVNLENNKLSEFRSDVFLSMLQQMAATPSGSSGGEVLVTGNPFKCDCGLAWLIRDNPILIPNVRNGVCGGFFRFEDLSPDSFADCS